LSAGLCPSCGTEIAADRLSCPTCHALIHAERLRNLVAAARTQEGTGDLTAAVASWQAALPLVPADSQQHGQMATYLADLGRRAAGAGSSASGQTGGPAARRGALATVGAIAVAILAKAKFLLLGLSKAGTLFTMLLSFGVYWTVFGWPFAAGLVLSIYVHEMGHMAALRRFGVKTGGPMFLPGIGAVIRLHQQFASPAEDARVGLAGPLWGLGAALAALGGFALTHQPIWAAIATTGAWINLFNLLPVWQLDGGRAFHALNRPQRWLAVAVIGATYLVTQEKLLFLLGLAATWRAFQKPEHEGGDRPMLLLYGALVLALALLTLVKLPSGVR